MIAEEAMGHVQESVVTNQELQLNHVSHTEHQTTDYSSHKVSEAY